MNQGYSGSSIKRKGDLVKKTSSDQGFVEDLERQRDLIALSRQTALLPRIDRITRRAIYMEFVEGAEGLNERNAAEAGKALRRLHGLSDLYPHSCFTGVEWLVELANENLAQAGDNRRIGAEILREYPNDALIHSEPTQFIEKADGSIVFIDIEGIGLGTRYQDLGFIYYITEKDCQPDIWVKFYAGYQQDAEPVDLARVAQMAGIVSMAYAGFGKAYVGLAEFEKRMELGYRLCGDLLR